MTFTDAELDALLVNLRPMNGSNVMDEAVTAITYLRAQLAERDDITPEKISVLRARVNRDFSSPDWVTVQSDTDALGAAVMRERAAMVANRLLVRAKFGTDTETSVIYSGFVAAEIMDLPLPTHAELLAHALTLPEIKALVDAVKVTQDTLCEGFCSDFPSGYTSVEIERDCGGCKSRAALAALGVNNDRT